MSRLFRVRSWKKVWLNLGVLGESLSKLFASLFTLFWIVAGSVIIALIWKNPDVLSNPGFYGVGIIGGIFKAWSFFFKKPPV